MKTVQCKPSEIIGEVLGDPSDFQRNPVNFDYLCPFINSQCIKRSQKISGPYPICSVFYGKNENRKLMCVCPKRFFKLTLNKRLLMFVGRENYQRTL
jgi:hypothetical protein